MEDVGRSEDLRPLAVARDGGLMVREVMMESPRSNRCADVAVSDLDAARSLVAHLFNQIAPEFDVESMGECESLQDVGKIDSLDFLRLVALTADTTGIVVPARDYPRLATLDGFARYLTERRATPVAK